MFYKAYQQKSYPPDKGNALQPHSISCCVSFKISCLVMSEWLINIVCGCGQNLVILFILSSICQVQFWTDIFRSIELTCIYVFKWFLFLFFFLSFFSFFSLKCCQFISKAKRHSHLLQIASIKSGFFLSISQVFETFRIHYLAHMAVPLAKIPAHKHLRYSIHV